MKLPTLYKETKSGAIQQWDIWTEGDRIYTKYGRLDGKKQTNYKTAKAKNVGKSNETTPEQQAKKEAKAKWQYKLDRKYSQSVEQAKEPLYFPMLAKPLDESKFVFPLDLQRKLDGLRCLAFWEDGQVKLKSRGGIFFTNLAHLQKQLENIIPKGDYVLDGEIYLHGLTFQQITRLNNTYRPGDTETLCFYAYDIVSKSLTDNPWRLRRQALEALIPAQGIDNIKRVETLRVNNLEEIWDKHALFVSEGYEGAIARLLDHGYTFNHNSDGLFKVKDFEDAEFKIIGYSEGEGRLRGCVIWECEAENGESFEVKQKGSLDELKELLEDADKYIGELLKVKFLGRTESNIPKIPVGLGIRPKEDL